MRDDCGTLAAEVFTPDGKSLLSANFLSPIFRIFFPRGAQSARRKRKKKRIPKNTPWNRSKECVVFPVQYSPVFPDSFIRKKVEGFCKYSLWRKYLRFIALLLHLFSIVCLSVHWQKASGKIYCRPISTKKNERTRVVQLHEYNKISKKTYVGFCTSHTVQLLSIFFALNNSTLLC